MGVFSERYRTYRRFSCRLLIQAFLSGVLEFRSRIPAWFPHPLIQRAYRKGQATGHLLTLGLFKKEYL